MGSRCECSCRFRVGDIAVFADGAARASKSRGPGVLLRRRAWRLVSTVKIGWTWVSVSQRLTIFVCTRRMLRQSSLLGGFGITPILFDGGLGW